MNQIILAWLVGEGIITANNFRYNKTVAANTPSGTSGTKVTYTGSIPPIPGSYLVSSGVFVLLAILAESDKARPFATLLAWGFDIAAFMNYFSGKNRTTYGYPWPPPLASNKVIFPNGQGTSTSTSNASTGTTGSVTT